MSLFTIKILGCLFMLIDHVGLIFFPDQEIWRIIGRLAFPIFAWTIANGYNYTKNVKKYFLRIFIFAIIAHVPFVLAFFMPEFIDSNFLHLNIFFTLLLGLSTIIVYDKFKINKIWRYLIIIFIAIFADLIKADYGFYGVAFVFLCYLFYNKNFYIFLSLFVLNCLYLIEPAKNFTEGLDFALPTQIFSIFAIVFIVFYNGKLGRKWQYFFYFFYPVHLLILFFIERIVF